jgi:hypothetical protein
MDTDSFMPHELAYDPIAMAFERDLKYLGRVVMDDAGEACHGMWNFIEDFTNSHEGLADRLARNGMRIPAPSPERLQAPISTYYNNFEVVHVPAFIRPDVAEWISSLETYWRGFYVHRWGESSQRSDSGCWTPLLRRSCARMRLSVNRRRRAAKSHRVHVL